MKIRKGFVTNSSSTNFLIISTNEITTEYLFEKLSGGKKSLFDEELFELCELLSEKICYSTQEIPEIENLKLKFGDQVESVIKKMGAKYIYISSTDSDNNELESFFTCFPSEFETDGLYLNALNSMW